MNAPIDKDLDLTISRIIKAPRAAVWSAWADPVNFAQWWLPAPLECEVVTMELRPGGALVTRMREPGAAFVPHLSACFLDIAPAERIVFTNALHGGWRPATGFYPAPLTATITFRDHPEGTEYESHVMHATKADCDKHDELGFEEGWGTTIGQLAALVTRR